MSRSVLDPDQGDYRRLRSALSRVSVPTSSRSHVNAETVERAGRFGGEAQEVGDFRWDALGGAGHNDELVLAKAAPLDQRARLAIAEPR